MKAHRYYVYIVASKSRTLYVGVTNDLARRIHEHKDGLLAGFTSRYRISRLVYFEETNSPRSAIAREKEIKGWRREKKVSLIEASNPTWDDLSTPWFEDKDEADPSLPLRIAAGRALGMTGSPARHPEAALWPRDLLVARLALQRDVEKQIPRCPSSSLRGGRSG